MLGVRGSFCVLDVCVSETPTHSTKKRAPSFIWGWPSLKPAGKQREKIPFGPLERLFTLGGQTARSEAHHTLLQKTLLSEWRKAAWDGRLYSSRIISPFESPLLGFCSR